MLTWSILHLKARSEVQVEGRPYVPFGLRSSYSERINSVQANF